MERNQQRRLVEALLFAAPHPVAEADIAARLPEDADVAALIEELRQTYENRGVQIVRIAGKWGFRTAPDLAQELRLETEVKRKLSRAALETLAIVAYHQPVTRAEIEDIRGVGYSRGALDTLLEAGWVKPGRRRRTPGRPVTWVTTEAFLEHFGLEGLDDLPGLDDLKAAGLLDKRPAVQAFSGGDMELVEGDANAEEDEETLPELTDPLEE